MDWACGGLCSEVAGEVNRVTVPTSHSGVSFHPVSFSLPSNQANDPLPSPTLQPTGIPDDPTAPTPEERVVAHAASVQESTQAASVRHENVDAAARHERAARGNDSSSVARFDPVTIFACLFSGVWALGTIVALIGILRSVWKLRSVIRRTQPCQSEDVRRVADQVCRILNISSLPPIVSSRDVAGPIVAGILRPRIVLSTRILPELSEDGTTRHFVARDGTCASPRSVTRRSYGTFQFTNRPKGHRPPEEPRSEITCGWRRGSRMRRASARIQPEFSQDALQGRFTILNENPARQCDVNCWVWFSSFARLVRSRCIPFGRLHRCADSCTIVINWEPRP